MGPLKQSLVVNISLQRCNCNIFRLIDTMGLFAKEAGFFRFWAFFRASSLQNKVGDPHFFYISDITNSSSFNGKICRKKLMLENFRANVLNPVPLPSQDLYWWNWQSIRPTISKTSALHTAGQHRNRRKPSFFIIGSHSWGYVGLYYPLRLLK